MVSVTVGIPRWGQCVLLQGLPYMDASPSLSIFPADYRIAPKAIATQWLSMWNCLPRAFRELLRQDCPMWDPVDIFLGDLHG